MDLRSVIVSTLEIGCGMEVTADLSCYKYGNQYCVEYWYDEHSINALNITSEQRKQIIEEEELLEFFDTPEEAADFCLKIGKGRIENDHRSPAGKRGLKEKIASVEKDEYF